ncbi:unnamed protein product [Nyctereutes procyonoides]|uniref:Cytochrome c oxidase assembly factor 3 n=1 Tax=Nyctereutes procyonoides TaxID=34880 RepID=A0A811Z803_NYCPR|nr:unnamed protein product [Nyctereutes procyonoides]
MAVPGAGDSLNAKSGQAPVAQCIDPTWEKLTPAQLQFMWQVELAKWQKRLPQRRTQNILTSLGIGAVERFLDELEDEAKAARARALARASGP